MASPAQIRSLTNHLRNAYGVKGYDDEDDRLAFIVDECSHIPEESLEEVKEIFKTLNAQRLPILFAEGLKQAFSEWIRKHPEKRTKQGTWFCKDCDGTGLLHFRDPKSLNLVFCFSCICGQFQSNGIPSRSRQGLLRDGWVEDSDAFH